MSQPPRWFRHGALVYYRSDTAAEARPGAIISAPWRSGPNWAATILLEGAIVLPAVRLCNLEERREVGRE